PCSGEEQHPSVAVVSSDQRDHEIRSLELPVHLRYVLRFVAETSPVRLRHDPVRRTVKRQPAVQGGDERLGRSAPAGILDANDSVDVELDAPIACPRRTAGRPITDEALAKQ